MLTEASQRNVSAEALSAAEGRAAYVGLNNSL